MNRLRLLSFLLIASVFVTTGQGCFTGGTVKGEPIPDVTLDYWRVFDGPDDFADIIGAYTELYPNVTINYRRLRFEEYEEELVRAFAEGRGPDIFTIHNTWMREYLPLIDPLPASLNLSRSEEQGTLRKQVVNVARTEPTMSLKDYKTSFVDAVSVETVIDNNIYGFPMSVDTLALYYNNDLLNAAGIPTAPTTWEAFQDQTVLLTATNIAGNIIQSGAALGTSENVERSTDILSLLMLQTGTDMISPRGNIAFNDYPEGQEEGTLPALDALEFYTDFANPTKEVYSWTPDSPNSFDAFANGEAAFFLGYSYHAPLLRTVAPKLNFEITNVPQIAGPDEARQVNFANFWVEVVAENVEYSDYAWKFLQFASGAEQVPGFLNSSRKPTALRSLITSQLESEDLGEFAEQLLTAESWYRGEDIDAAEEALNELIDNYLSGTLEAEDALDLAANKVAQTY
jgi:multiple sugar transport system substrate-binding protein